MAFETNNLVIINAKGEKPGSRRWRVLMHVEFHFENVMVPQKAYSVAKQIWEIFEYGKYQRNKGSNRTIK